MCLRACMRLCGCTLPGCYCHVSFRLLEDLLRYIHSIARSVEENANKPTAKFWRVLLNKAYDVLDKVWPVVTVNTCGKSPSRRHLTTALCHPGELAVAHGYVHRGDEGPDGQRSAFGQEEGHGAAEQQTGAQDAVGPGAGNRRKDHAQDVLVVVVDADLLFLRLLHSCSSPATSSGS